MARSYKGFRRELEKENFEDNDMVLINGSILVKYSEINEDIAEVVYNKSKFFQKMIRLNENHGRAYSPNNREVFVYCNNPRFYGIFKKTGNKAVRYLKSTETCEFYND